MRVKGGFVTRRRHKKILDIAAVVDVAKNALA